ncbi:AAA family ATPase [Microbispora sp. GKU 823]|uniref:AAA family ATPase n=1 Tax=Microbispora sp. GKU 823 TaxID=1652100 RepID=UPI0009A317A8|nr:AAA family ATPase [Microbispora sp. GKU 823]OPG12610.1 hypothetical protein B1L11_13695 [Microbispora sp. GKU 823]
MSKRNRRHSAGAAPERAATPAKGADELVTAAEELDTGDEPISDSDVTGEVDADRLRRALARAEAARRHADQRAAVLDKKTEELEKATATLAQERAELRERTEAADELDKRLAERQAHLLALEEEAKRDFAGYRQRQLGLLREELDERRKEFDERLRAMETEHDARYAQREKALLDRAAELDRREARMDAKELEQRRLDRRLNARQEHLDQEVDDRMRDRLVQLERELELARHHARNHQRQSEAMRELAERRAAELARHEAASVELGRSVPEAAAELRRLRAENRELRAAASAHPVASEERLAELEARCHDLRIEREEWLRENAELRRHVAAAAISTTERQNAAMINDALRRQNEALAKELDHQSALLKQMQNLTKDSPPFPACSAMDDDPDYRLRPQLDDEPVRLRDFVARVRGRMALDLGLYYSESDLRCFVAGLAASRLHLLQGISGIGKTRLPEAFAQIIGAGRETVAVAAEWRSPQDLLGYYNAFERKFYESEFTQSLYRAQLPLFREKPFFVVLDEMNLSHPEQYFSDLLSALERKEGDPAERPVIPLMTAPVSPAPALLHGGRALELPGNVWFVGTANHDETTLRFADKTYDRAHVLELPSKPRRFEPGESRPFASVSLKALLDAFTAAERKHAGTADEVLTFFDDRLGAELRDRFGVSWGSRLERQARSFVPVMVAAGGGVSEAADHLLATKVLRKLSGRVEILAGDLRELRDDITRQWGEAFPGTTPVKSLRLLDQEMRSMGQL